MNCPTCKNPNPQGATHCSVCYEVFNRSAADAFVRQSRRERHEREQADGDAIPEPARGYHVPKDPTVDWKALRSAAATGLWNTRWIFIGAAVVLASSVLVLQLRSPLVWFSFFGTRLEHRFIGADTFPYLSTFTSEYSVWTESQGRLVSPLGEGVWDELGTLVLRRRAGSRGQRVIQVDSREWIRTHRQNAALGRGQRIPTQHPTLRGGTLTINAKGKLLRRDYPPNTLVSRALQFLVPQLPAKRVKRGARWTEKVEWTDTVSGWKIHWTGNIAWTLSGLEKSGDRVPVGAIGVLTLQARIWDGPSWASSGIRRAYFVPGPSEARLYFDRHQGRVISDRVTYEGSMRIPLDSLSRIPSELHVGRTVNAPGELVLKIKNRIDHSESSPASPSKS